MEEKDESNTRSQAGCSGGLKERLSMAGTINQIVYLANIHIYEALAKCCCCC